MNKKLFLAFLGVLLILGMIVACNNSSPLAASDSEELVSVSFEDSDALKSLTAEVSGMANAVEASYWFYTAVKTDGGPATGKTSADDTHQIADKVPVQRKSTDPASGDYNKAVTGLKDKVATGFSVGEWTFRLYGYNNESGTPGDSNVNVTFSSPWPDTEGTPSVHTQKGTSATLRQGFVTKVKVPVLPKDAALADSTTGGKLVIEQITAPLGSDNNSATMKYRYNTSSNKTTWNGWNTWTEFSSDVELTDVKYPYLKVEIGAFYQQNYPDDPPTYPANPQLSETILVMLYKFEDADGKRIVTTISGSLDNIQAGVEFDPSTGTVVQVKYDANGANSGNVPVDKNGYKPGNPVTVLRNEGNLAKDGYIFAGWNTKPDGSGTSYQPNDTFPAEDITLYAVWAVVTELPKVGGTIYYMVDTTDGYNSYRFFKESGEEITAAQNNNNIRGGYFADAYYVLETGKSGKDKFYVFDSRKDNSGNYIGLVSGKEWGAKGTNVGINTDGIGKGKTNTETALGYAAAHPGVQPNPFESGTSPNYGTNTIWTWLDTINTYNRSAGTYGGGTSGCTDWFIPSMAELDQLRNYTGYESQTVPGIPDWFGTKNIWSSVELSDSMSHYWGNGSGGLWGNANKDHNGIYVVAVRAF